MGTRKPDQEDQTVATLATAAGAGGIAVVLLAGPRAGEILAGIFRRRTGAAAPGNSPGRLLLGDLYENDARLDEVVIRLQGLGEGQGELAEINIHGGPRVMQRVLALLAARGAEVQPWQPEMAGRWGLWPYASPGHNNPALVAELLQTLPRARTRLAASLLMHQMDHGLTELAERALVGCAAPLHTAVPAGPSNNVNRANPPVCSEAAHPTLAAELTAAADRFDRVERLLTPAEVVVAGPPNAGKSSLVNALVGRDVCIVTDTPGTTRDWVRELADVRGCPVWLTDTAGLWETADAVDEEAVRRAWTRVEKADVVLAVYDVNQPPPADEPHWRRLLSRPNVLLVANKIDLAARNDPGAVAAPFAATTDSAGASGNAWLQKAQPRHLGISTATRAGLDELRGIILSRLGLPATLSADLAAAFTPRQADLLRQAVSEIATDPVAAAGCLWSLLVGE